MRHSLAQHRALWSNARYRIAVLSGILLLIIGLESSELARHHLQNSLRGRWEPDLLLDHLPVMQLEFFLAWGLEILIGFLLAVATVYPEYLPFSLKTIGLLYLIRSFFIILTPLGARPDQVVIPTAESTDLFYNLAYGSNEFFFSGHVSFPFILSLVFWHKPFVRYVLLISTLLFAIGVLLAHTHYSIDVFAALVMVPTIFGFCRFIFREDVRFTHERYTADRANRIPPIL